MEGIRKPTHFEKRLQAPIGITILIGVILKIINNPYGDIVFTIGFLAYFLLKLFKLFKVKKFFWNKLHTLQLILLVLAALSLILMYFDYPYSRIAFVTLLLFESIVNLKIMINAYIGNDNFKTILSFIGRLLRR